MAIKNIIAKGIGFSQGSVKFIPTHVFIASAVVPFAPPFNISDTLGVIQSHLASSGYFQLTQIGRPRQLPRGAAFSASIWLRRTTIPIVTLKTAIKLYTIVIRVYRDMLAEPTESIELDLSDIISRQAATLTGDFSLGANVRNIDIGGIRGTPMRATWGHESVGGVMYRTADLIFGLEVNDTANFNRSGWPFDFGFYFGFEA